MIEFDNFDFVIGEELADLRNLASIIRIVNIEFHFIVHVHLSVILESLVLVCDLRVTLLGHDFQVLVILVILEKFVLLWFFLVVHELLNSFIERVFLRFVVHA